jgi:hypothetical protein
MANWQNKLDLKDLWEKYDKGELAPREIGKQLSVRLLKLMPSLPKEFQEEIHKIALAFETEIDDIDDFDNILNDLYDLADTPLPTPAGQMQRKLMWVATSF